MMAKRRLAYNSPAMEKRTLLSSVAALLLCAAALAQQTPARPPSPANDLASKAIEQARKANGEGKYDEAIALYRQALAANAKAYQAELGISATLDLEGKYDEARQHIQKAIDMAPEQAKLGAMRAMAISYAFERKAADAAKYEEPAFQAQLAKAAYYDAGEAADELARIYIESGDLDNAEKWYKLGHDTGLKEPNISQARKDLWEFRWEHAQARIAARGGRKDEAQKHVQAAKAILDRGTNPDQARFLPYLEGYVAFYSGDYTIAIDDLKKADQRDPFILVLLAQAYEKSGDQQQATENYRKVLASNIHNPTSAFARPIAKEKLGSAS
jgi:tetratricopeptide (TPR) repeat protein